MANKKTFELSLTPQNEEWVKLIPNHTQNIDIIMNKLIDTAISEGLMLEVISGTLTITDLRKFSASYEKLQSTRASFFEGLDIAPVHTERKKVTQTVSTEIEQETIEAKPKKEKTKKENTKKAVGFDEDVF